MTDNAPMQDGLVLRRKGIFAQSLDTVQGPEDSPDPVQSMIAAMHCCSQEGFASEGMLCNDPPIPLRVLDFLDDSKDLLNLAMVCKATHQAGHVLLQRKLTATAPWATRALITVSLKCHKGWVSDRHVLLNLSANYSCLTNFLQEGET
jgi:hypothetical protein